MAKREHPRAIPRTGADLARAARTAKAAIKARVSSPGRPAAQPDPAAPAPKPTGGYAGVIGAPSEQSPPPLAVIWIPFPGSNRIPPQEGK